MDLFASCSFFPLPSCGSPLPPSSCCTSCNSISTAICVHLHAHLLERNIEILAIKFANLEQIIFSGTRAPPPNFEILATNPYILETAKRVLIKIAPHPLHMPDKTVRCPAREREKGFLYYLLVERENRSERQPVSQQTRVAEIYNHEPSFGAFEVSRLSVYIIFSLLGLLYRTVRVVCWRCWFRKSVGEWISTYQATALQASFELRANTV